jgi:hypothetical protein
MTWETKEHGLVEDVERVCSTVIRLVVEIPTRYTNLQTQEVEDQERRSQTNRENKSGAKRNWCSKAGEVRKQEAKEWKHRNGGGRNQRASLLKMRCKVPKKKPSKTWNHRRDTKTRMKRKKSGLLKSVKRSNAKHARVLSKKRECMDAVIT